MPLIPMTFHFSFFRGSKDWRWRDIHTLCLRSCLRVSGAEKVIVHYDREDTGPLWEEARALGGNIEWRKVEFAPTISGHPVSDQRIICDVYRLRTLWEEGGWYCDLDFVFLKSFDPLRDAVAVIGTQCKQKCKLACGLMGCVPGAPFIKAYLDSYATWTPKEEKTFWTYANRVPWDLSSKHEVTILPRSKFYPVAWSNKTFWAGARVPLKNSVALHLWETLKPLLTVEDLKKTCLREQVEQMMTDQSGGIAQRLPGVTLTWE